MIFNKNTKTTQLGKNSLFIKCWENWVSTQKSEVAALPYAKINSKWVKDLWEKSDTGFGNVFLDETQKSTGNKSKNRQTGLHQT